MKKILLVDDKATIGRVLKIYLGTEYDLEYFENPLKALEWLNEGNIPDLIISDIHMPHMRGNEFLYYLKGNELFRHIPVVMLSSEESTVERIQLLEAGAAGLHTQAIHPLNSGHASRNTLKKQQGRYVILYLHRKRPNRPSTI